MIQSRLRPSRQSLARLLRQLSLNDLALVLTIAMIGAMMLGG